MRLLSLRVSHFKGISAREVEFRPAGITVIQGPNEVGKTSLMRAFDILVDFPDSSRNSEVEATRPATQDVPTEIEARFEIGGDTFTYFKRYHRDKETRLIVESATKKQIVGREAHDYVKHMFETKTDWELWKALKIEQGAAADAAAKVALANSTSLREALDRAAGGSSGQSDDTLFYRVQEEWRSYYTPTGKESIRVFEGPRRLVNDLSHQAADLRQQISQAESDAEQIEHIRRQISELTGHRAEAEDELRAIERELSGIQQLESGHREALEAQSRVQDRLTGLEEQWRERRTLLERLAERTNKLTQLEQRQHEVKADIMDAESALAAVKGDHRDASKAADKARETLKRRIEDAEIFSVQAEVANLGKQGDRIRQFRNDLASWKEELSRLAVTEKGLHGIRKQAEKVNAAQAALEVGAPSAVVRALRDVAVGIHDESFTMAQGQERHFSISEYSAIRLADVVEVGIQPGASISEMQAKRDSEVKALSELFQKYGVSSAGEAEDQWRRCQTLASKIEGAETELAQELAGLELSELEQRHDELRRRVENYRKQRGADYVFAANWDEARSAAEQAQRAMNQANDRVLEITPLLEAASGRLRSLNGEREALAAAVLDETGHLKAVTEQLARMRGEISDQDLETLVQTARTELGGAKGHAASTAAKLAALAPEKIRLRAEQKRGEVANAANRSTELATLEAEIRGRLGAIGGQGLYEDLEQVELDLRKAQSDLASLERRAQAARTLFEVLRACRDQEQSRYREPLREQIVQIGKVVFGNDFDVELNDSLMVESRVLNGISLPVEALSTGAKEQLALLTRLAAASLVDPADGVPVILDDTLGHTDDDRLDLMAAVLGRVAKTSQIILLTSAARRYVKISNAHVVDLWANSSAVMSNAQTGSVS